MGPEPLTGRRGRPPRAARRAPAPARAAATARPAGGRSPAGASPAGRRRARRSALGVEPAVAPARRSRSSSRVDGGRGQPARPAARARPQRRQLDRLHDLAHALDQRVARLDLAGHVGAEAGRRARAAASASSGAPAMRWRRAARPRRRRCRPPGRRRPGCACRSVTRSGGSSGTRRAEAPRAPRRRGSGPSTPGHSTTVVGPAPPRPSQLVGEVERGEQRAERVQAVGRAAARRAGRG